MIGLAWQHRGAVAMVVKRACKSPAATESRERNVGVPHHATDTVANLSNVLLTVIVPHCPPGAERPPAHGQCAPGRLRTVLRCFSKGCRLRILVNKSAVFSSVGTYLTVTTLPILRPENSHFANNVLKSLQFKTLWSTLACTKPRAIARTRHLSQPSRCSSSGILLDNGTKTFGGRLSAGGCGSSYQRERGQSSASRRSCQPSRLRRTARGQAEWTWWPTLGRRTFMRRTCPSHGVQTMK